MPTATPTAELTGEQFAELFRRMLWGLRWVEKKARAFDLNEIPAGSLSEAAKLALQNRDARVKISSAIIAANTLLGNLPTLIDDPNKPKLLRARLDAIIAQFPDRWETTVREVFDDVDDALRAGFDAINADLEWQGQIAQSQMDFWARVLEVTELPSAIWRKVVAGVKEVATAAASVGASTLASFLAGLKPLLIPAALALGGYLIVTGGK